MCDRVEKTPEGPRLRPGPVAQVLDVSRCVRLTCRRGSHTASGGLNRAIRMTRKDFKQSGSTVPKWYRHCCDVV